ncbi:MAG: TolC family protein [Saprospiraceae bacterium]
MSMLKAKRSTVSKMMNVRISYLTLWCVSAIWLFSQDFSYGQKVLTIQEVFAKVRAHHPLITQAMMQNDFAAAEILKAKGNFDPSISTTINQKNFDSKEYYSLLHGELNLPTWIGADIKTGYELNRGVFLSPENSTPGNGLFYGGISMPIGQGLLIDERRAAVQSSRIMQDFASARQIDLTNEVLYQAASTYWEWFRAYNVRQIFRTSLDNAMERYQAVRFNAASGDRPAIDTTEAKIQIQNISLGLNQAETEYKVMSRIFSGLFWGDNNIHTGLNPDEMPNDLEKEIRENALDAMMIEVNDFTSNHPYLEQLRQKIHQLEVERKLKRDKLKPKINLQYNPLIEPIGSNIFTNYNINNYKWGMEFKMPLFLRKERGDIKLAELKLKETNLILQNKTVELFNKYNAYITEWQATLDQIEIFDEAVRLYEQMLIAERRLFNVGESSLFLVNSREQSFINAKIKLTELVAKNKLAYYSIFYFAGQLDALQR